MLERVEFEKTLSCLQGQKEIKNLFSRGCILHTVFYVVSRKLFTIDIPVYFVAKCCAGKCVIDFLSHIELAKNNCRAKCL